MKNVPKDEASIRKMKEKHPKKYCNTYKERALAHYGLVCQRCGKALTEEEAIVHHIDGNNDSSNIDNHDIDNLMVLCKGCYSKLHSEIRKQGEQFVGLDHFRRAANEIFKGLEQMGLDISDVNFKDTPNRVARAYYEIFSGVQDTNKEIANILATGFPSEGYNSMVIAIGVTAFSMCPHHLLPVEYKICVGYIPSQNGKVLGISKLSRLVQLLAKRPVLQETLGEDIVNALMSIGAQGAGVMIAGRHMCMRMRGVKDPNATVNTHSLRGNFMDEPTRQEFIAMCKDGLSFK